MADRMGVRLDGATLGLTEPRELVSQPVVPGSIQVPPDGQPIVLMPECQTIGGYPQIGHVISADLPKLARAWPGTPIRFREVSLDEARRAWLEQQALGPPPAGPDPEQQRLARWRWQLAALARQPRIEAPGRILLRRRQSSADDPARSPAHGAVLAEALAQAGEAGVTVTPAAAGPAGFRLAWPEPQDLTISVVVLSRDRPDLLAACLASVEASRGPVRLEWLVVDNGSRLEATAALLRHWQQRPGASCRRLEMDEPFHWSRLNNRAAAEATMRAEAAAALETVGIACATGSMVSYMSHMGLAASLMLDFRCVIVPRFVYATGDAFKDGKLADEAVQTRMAELCGSLSDLARRRM
jgi:hypothetical protein